MIASLMMYARPELDAAHARYWRLIRACLSARGIASPKTLSNAAEPFELWRNPALVLSQTCGLPLRTALYGKVALVGTPDYGLPGCPPGYYASPLVVRADDPRDQLADFAPGRLAYNATHSQSGFASVYQMAQQEGLWFDSLICSGAHLASARMVAEGAADIAALDGVTWALMQRYDSFARTLRVLTTTQPTPGLPYITALGADVDGTFDAVSEAIDTLSAADREALMLTGLVKIPEAAYWAVPTPPPDLARP